MTIFIDNEFRCHLEYKDGYREVNTTLFDSTLPEAVECFRYIPPGETWHNGSHSFLGEMITPYLSSVKLAAMQSAVDRAHAQAQQAIDEYEQALTEIEKALGVNV